MSRSAPCLTVLVLTEDSSKQSHAVWEKLLKRAFKLLVPDVGTHRIHFDPQEGAEREVMVANRWKEKRGRQKQVALSRAIATRILEQDPPGFVAFHVDGDRRWSDRAGSENVQKFKDLIVPKVERLLQDRLKRDQDPVDLDELSRHMERLLLVVPFYSVEAWLFQNIARLRELCPPAEHPLLDSWSEDRALIDEVLKPKASLSVGAQKNEELASQWPQEEAYDAGASFTVLVDEQLMPCGDLLAALGDTIQ